MSIRHEDERDENRQRPWVLVVCCGLPDATLLSKLGGARPRGTTPTLHITYCDTGGVSSLASWWSSFEKPSQWVGMGVPVNSFERQ